MCVYIYIYITILLHCSEPTAESWTDPVTPLMRSLVIDQKINLVGRPVGWLADLRCGSSSESDTRLSVHGCARPVGAPWFSSQRESDPCGFLELRGWVLGLFLWLQSSWRSSARLKKLTNLLQEPPGSCPLSAAVAAAAPSSWCWMRISQWRNLFSMCLFLSLFFSFPPPSLLSVADTTLGQSSLR